MKKNFKEKLSGVLRSEKLSSGTLTAIIICIVIALNVVFYALGVTFYRAVESDDLTLTGATDAIFTKERIEGKKVTITFCQAYDSMINNEEDSARWVINTAEQLAERYPDFIELRFANIMTMMVVSKTDGMPVEKIDLRKYQEKDENGELIPIYSDTIIFECGSNVRLSYDFDVYSYTEFLTLTTSSDPEPLAYHGEEVFASMINSVLDGDLKKAYFTKFHGETADIGFRTMLIGAGYEVNTIDLREKEIPEDADLIVISNPQNDFEMAAEDSGVRTEIERLDDFTSRGGDLYVAIDPYSDKLPVLESFLARYGIEISSYTKENGNFYRNIVRDTDNAITTDYYTLVGDFADSEVGTEIFENVSKYTDSKVIIGHCAALKLSKNATPLLVSSSSAGTYAGGTQTDNSGSYCLSAVSYAKDTHGDPAGRIMVTPSVYLTATDSLISGEYANRDFLYATMDVLFGIDNVPYGCTPIFMSSDVLFNLTMGAVRIYTAIIFAIPATIAVVGCVIIIRRKNR